MAASSPTIGNVASNDSGTGTANTITIVLPTVLDNEIGIIGFSQNGTQAVNSITGGSGSWGSALANPTTSSNNNRVTAYKKVMAASDSGATVTISLAGAQRWVVGYVGIQGPVSDFDVVTSSSNNTEALTQDAPSVDPTSGFSMWIVIMGARDSTVGTQVTWTGTTGGFTERIDRSTSNGANANIGLLIATSPITADTATGTQTFSLTPSASAAAISLIVSPSLQPVGIPSAEVFGSDLIIQYITAVGIPSAGVFGSDLVVQYISAVGIPSQEKFGTDLITQYITAVGIPSAEKFGTDLITQYVSAVGIPSAENFGSITVTQSIAAVGIPSQEAFGSASLFQTINAVGIKSEEAFGSHQISQSIAATGISSQERFGSHRIVLYITAVGLPGEEGFGSAQITPGQVDILAVGISSSEVFGSASVADVGMQIAAVGIPSQEAFGSASLSQTIHAIGIPGQERFGSASLFVVLTIQDSSQSQTVDGVVLSQDQIITMQDATQRQSSENITLNGVMVKKARHALTSDEIALVTQMSPGKVFSIEYDVEKIVSRSFVIRYDVRTAISSPKTFVVRYDVKKQVEVPAEVVYDVEVVGTTRVFKEFKIVYHTLSSASHEITTTPLKIDQTSGNDTFAETMTVGSSIVASSFSSGSSQAVMTTSF